MATKVSNNSSKHRVARRALPNIRITGTPGVGKSTLCEALVDVAHSNNNNNTSLKLHHVKVNDVIKQHALYTDRDQQRGDCLIVDDDMLIEHLGPTLVHNNSNSNSSSNNRGGYLIDTHLCDCWPAQWIDLVVVLRCDNTVLYDRLEHRYDIPT